MKSICDCYAKDCARYYTYFTEIIEFTPVLCVLWKSGISVIEYAIIENTNNFISLFFYNDRCQIYY